MVELKKDKVFFLSSLFLIVVGILSIIDVFMDSSDQLSPFHILGEFILIGLSLLGSAFFIYQAVLHRTQANELRTQVKDLKLQNSRYLEQVQKIKKGLSEAIDTEFESWNLTPTEKEVGIMIIKGLSYSEISNIRNISEKTARNQGSSILAKSGLKNKNELIAYFLEDLLYPNV